ncbi:hypothetical protein PV325_006650 [Microctonus aethiopoides]|nr:hypothetical protein PV325_006650 [Microctonus aethiopoides]
MAFVNYTLHIPSEYLIHNDYKSLIENIIEEMENFANVYGNYNGFTTTKNSITSFLIIDDILKIYWLRRINSENDHRPFNVNCYPPLAPIETEMETRQRIIRVHQERLALRRELAWISEQ